MKLFAVALFFQLFLYGSAHAQSSLKITVLNPETDGPVPGATVTVESTGRTYAADLSGIVTITEVPEGEQVLRFFSPGYEEVELRLTFPVGDRPERTVYMRITNEVATVTVNSTRTGREIENEPTRVEAIDEEEIDEKLTMRPANVSMVLNESTGIKVQQTSATSNTQNIRIQGLDGRYTQILKDGFPSFGGFSGSLSLLEIPPLDLRQVEIIKGPSATFYGEGAIAGVVNFISKEPEDEGFSTALIFNQTSAMGTDASVFNTGSRGGFGYTLLASANFQREYDADDDGFTELPRTRSFAVSPKFFLKADDKTSVMIGNSTSHQRRLGGDVFVIRGEPGPDNVYFEKNESVRNITTFSYNRDFSGGRRLLAKQALAVFDRRLNTPGYLFKGLQFNSYTDVAYFTPAGSHGLVFGFSAAYDNFSEADGTVAPEKRDQSRAVVGGYVQDTFDISDRVSLEAGFRLDHAKDYGTFALPRFSLLYRFTDRLTSRIGLGLGYKTPTVFTEDAETLLFRSVLPVGDNLEAERSRGGTFDVNYRDEIGENFSYSVNHMFFYTSISDPLVLELTPDDLYRFRNAESPIISKGFETNVRASYAIAKLFVGYTFTDATAGYLPGDRKLPLVPKHKINSALIFEEHESFKAGLEAHFTGRQTLSDRTLTRSFLVVGLFGEKTFGKVSFFINAENITDVRQGRYSTVVLPPTTDPAFAEVYTHLEGRIFNGGVKVRF